MADSLLERIKRALGKPLNAAEFEAQAVELLSQHYPNLVPVEGGSDAGMDGAGSVDGRAFLLIATTGKDVLSNLTRNLTSHRDAGGSIRIAVVATSQSLSGKRRANLVQKAAELGFDLDESRIYDRGALAALLYRNPAARRSLLGIDDPVPALTPLSPGGRFEMNVPLVRRDGLLRELEATATDLVVVGKPGIGKTAVLEHLASDGWGLFVDQTTPRDRVEDKVLELAPPRIILDDAHLSGQRLEELLALRRHISAKFAIVVTTWPGAADMLAQALPESTRIEIPELPRDAILEVIEGLGVGGPRELQALIVRQALGRPGLAAMMARAALTSDPNEVAKGNALYGQVVAFTDNAIGPESRKHLAVLALTGDGGLSVDELASILEVSVFDAWAVVRGLARSGMLDEVTLYGQTNGRLRVQPVDLRFALVAREFGEVGSPDVRHLLGRLPDAREAVVPLVGAFHRGAVSLRRAVHVLADHALSEKQAAAVATMGPDEAEIVFERFPEHRLAAAQEAMDHSPEAATRILLNLSVGDDRPRHSYPEQPMRWLSDYLARPGTSFEVRKAVSQVATRWAAEGGDVDVALEALAACADARLEGSFVDPGRGNTFTLFRAPLDVARLEEGVRLWEPIARLVAERHPTRLEPAISALHHWVFPQISGFGEDLRSEVRSAYVLHAVAVIEMLADAAQRSGRWGLLSELRFLARNGELGTQVAGNSFFDLVFPDDRLGPDRDPMHRQAAAAAELLGAAFADLEAMVELLARAEHEAATIGRNWPRLGPVVLRAHLSTARPDLATVIDTLERFALSGDYTAVVLGSLVSEKPVGWDDLVARFIQDPDNRFVAVQYGLLSDSQRLQDLALQHLMAGDRLAVQAMVARGQLGDAILLRLLRHPVTEIRSTVAGHLFGGSVGRYSSEIWEARREALVTGDPEDYWLAQALEADPEILADWIKRWLISTTSDDSITFLPREVAELLPRLSKEQRLSLLAAIPHGANQWALSGLITGLVQEDFDAAALVFANEWLRPWQAATLQSDPDEAWLARALLAAEHGWTPSAIVREIRHRMMSWSGESSAHWNTYVEGFRVLKGDSPTAEAIIAEGIAHFTELREAALAEEHREAVFGRE